MKLSLQKTETLTDRIRLLTFGSATAQALPPYTPGAHLAFDLGGAGKRAYSLIDWPGGTPAGTGAYLVAVQREDGGTGGSIAMHALEPGRIIGADPPENDFPLAENAAPVLLLAGGIGITPLISMATRLQSRARPFQLHYTARSAKRMAFAERLTGAFTNAVHLYFDDTAPLDLPALMAAQAPGTEVYVCGPRGMIDAARTAAVAAGIPEESVRIELFAAPKETDGDTAFEVEIHQTGQVIRVAADQTIITALEAAGLDVMYDCRRGDCGICQCEVISGIPDHRDVVLSRSEQAAGKLMQICVSRAKSARLVLDI